jgi:hypothetical protein
VCVWQTEARRPPVPVTHAHCAQCQQSCLQSPVAVYVALHRFQIVLLLHAATCARHATSAGTWSPSARHVLQEQGCSRKHSDAGNTAARRTPLHSRNVGQIDGKRTRHECNTKPHPQRTFDLCNQEILYTIWLAFLDTHFLQNLGCLPVVTWTRQPCGWAQMANHPLHAHTTAHHT